MGETCELIAVCPPPDTWTFTDWILLLLKRFLLQHCQTSHREVHIPHCFAEIKAVCSHIAQYYANLWMHFLATRASIRLLCYKAGNTDSMKKLGEMGQKRGSSLLASPHLSGLMAHLFIISPAKSIIHIPGKSCDTKESWKLRFAWKHESFNLRPQISLEWHWQSVSVHL